MVFSYCLMFLWSFTPDLITMFGSFLPPVICWYELVLFTFFVFVCGYWCPTHIVLCFGLFFIVLCAVCCALVCFSSSCVSYVVLWFVFHRLVCRMLCFGLFFIVLCAVCCVLVCFSSSCVPYVVLWFVFHRLVCRMLCFGLFFIVLCAVCCALVCFSSSCVPYVANFSELSLCYYPFGILERLLNKRTNQHKSIHLQTDLIETYIARKLLLWFSVSLARKLLLARISNVFYSPILFYWSTLYTCHRLSFLQSI